MTVQRHYDTITIVASQDLRDHQFKAVSLGGLVAGTTADAIGILQTKPMTNDHATLAYRGHMKAFVGAAVNSGALLGVTTSGFLIAVNTIGQVASGTTINGYVGRALTSASSGALVEFLGDFIMGRLA